MLAERTNIRLTYDDCAVTYTPNQAPNTCNESREGRGSALTQTIELQQGCSLKSISERQCHYSQQKEWRTFPEISCLSPEVEELVSNGCKKLSDKYDLSVYFPGQITLGPPFNKHVAVDDVQS